MAGNLSDITLNQIEQTLAKLIAQERYRTNRNSKVINNKIGKQTNEITDLNGIGAEIAFCKLANLYPDFSISPRQGSPDCISRTGKRIDVKTTTHQNGHLIAVRSTKPGNVDYYVLMIGNFPNYTYRGYCTSKELIQENRLKNFGYGKLSYALGQKELKKEILK